MKPLFTRLSAFAAVLLLGGCAQYATVTEITPHRAGFAVKASDPRAALERYVAAAESAWQKLNRNPADVEARQDYNFAVARICGTLRESKFAPWKAPIPLGAHTLAWKRHPLPVWNPALYDLIPTDQLKISGTYFDVRETRPGLGAPVVAKRVADQLHDYAPTPHFYYAATVVARFEGSHCVLAIEDPLETETVRVDGRTFPLAAGFTSPLAMMLVEMKPKSLELPRLLHPAKFAATTRIARLEPYDPKKTVVLFVHGLMDSPATWFPLINHLRADEDIRRNYQFWFFSYPSGYPYPYSAAILRRELDEAEKRYPLHKKMVVIGHSMGSCISRLLITDSGRKIWDQMFTVEPERMDVTPEHRHILTESTIFSSRPEIGRVIFISAPHRGSDLATDWFGRIAASLVQAPKILMSVGRDEMRYEKQRPGILHLKRFPDSVDTMAPDNDFVVALKTVPIKKGIPYHTIAGDRGRGDSPNSSDGVVPYWSSHLPDAVSEKMVPSHHTAHQNPQAIEEVHRILAPRRFPINDRRMNKTSASSIPIGFPHARYHTEWELISWHPRGVLDDQLVDEIHAFIHLQEQVATAPPFNRFMDLSTLKEVRLQIGHVFKVAEERKAAGRGLAPVKSAFYCEKMVGFGMARMYEALMEGSSIHVRAFRDRAAAAEWLGVPVEILSEDDSTEGKQSNR